MKFTNFIKSNSFRNGIYIARHFNKIPFANNLYSRLLNDNSQQEWGISHRFCRICASLLIIFMSVFAVSSTINAQQQMSNEDLLRKHYIRPVAKSFADSHGKMTNVMMPYIGTGSLSIFTVGAQGTFALRNKEETNFQNTNGEEIKVGDLATIPPALFGFGYYVGVNLGFFLSFVPVVGDIDVLFGFSINDMSLLGVTFNQDSYCLSLRYEVLSGISFLGGLGGWTGLYANTGFVKSKIHFSLDAKGSDSPIANVFDEAKAVGLGISSYKIDSDVWFFPLEVSTGLDIIVMNLTAAFGVGLGKGNTTYTFLSQSDTIGSNGMIAEEVEPDAAYPYLRFGVEFSFIPFVRFGGEVTYNISDRIKAKNALSFNFGIRGDI